MKHNYLLYIFLFFIILFRNVFVNMVNNIGYLIFNQKENVTIMLLETKNRYLEKQYEELLDFKNNINISFNYKITNAYMNNYSFDKLILNGNYNKGDEVVTTEGLIGIINNNYNNYSDVTYIYDTKLPVIINNTEGKIIGKDSDNNLIVKELTNYNNININDKVYSINNTYIGKIIKINREAVDINVIVETVNMKNINYVAVISRQV